MKLIESIAKVIEAQTGIKISYELPSTRPAKPLKSNKRNLTEIIDLGDIENAIVEPKHSSTTKPKLQLPLADIILPPNPKVARIQRDDHVQTAVKSPKGPEILEIAEISPQILAVDLAESQKPTEEIADDFPITITNGKITNITLKPRPCDSGPEGAEVLLQHSLRPFRILKFKFTDEKPKNLGKVFEESKLYRVTLDVCCLQYDDPKFRFNAVVKFGVIDESSAQEEIDEMLQKAEKFASMMDDR